jgi:hypothetical protein
MEAGPLPALFLREASSALQKTRVPLGLFLGLGLSDRTAKQVQRRPGRPFCKPAQDRPTGVFQRRRYRALHRDLPDLRGRTGLRDLPQRTPELSEDGLEAQRHHGRHDMVVSQGARHAGRAGADRRALRSSFGAAYEAYLTKVATFSKPPEIGDKWPADGYFIPSKRAFLAEFEEAGVAQHSPAPAADRGGSENGGAVGWPLLGEAWRLSSFSPCGRRWHRRPPAAFLERRCFASATARR